jgi:hypothetical protein
VSRAARDPQYRTRTRGSARGVRARHAPAPLNALITLTRRAPCATPNHAE